MAAMGEDIRTGIYRRFSLLTVLAAVLLLYWTLSAENVRYFFGLWAWTYGVVFSGVYLATSYMLLNRPFGAWFPILWRIMLAPFAASIAGYTISYMQFMFRIDHRIGFPVTLADFLVVASFFPYFASKAWILTLLLVLILAARACFWPFPPTVRPWECR